MPMAGSAIAMLVRARRTETTNPGSASGSAGHHAQPRSPPSQASTSPSTRPMARSEIGLPIKCRSPIIAVTDRDRGHAAGSGKSPDGPQASAVPSIDTDTGPAPTGRTTISLAPVMPHQPGAPVSRAIRSASACTSGRNACRDSISARAFRAASQSPVRNPAVARPRNASRTSACSSTSRNNAAAAGLSWPSVAEARTRAIVPSAGASRCARSNQRSASFRSPEANPPRADPERANPAWANAAWPRANACSTCRVSR